MGGTLRAVGFDVDRLEVTSDPVPVLEGVLSKESGAVDFGVSQSGSLAYVTGSVGVKRRLVWVDRKGSEDAIRAEPRAYRYPRMSPDGTRLALDVADQEADIWIWDFARERLTRLTFDTARDIYPTWSPDRLRVAFASDRDGEFQIFSKAADGTGAVEKLVESPHSQRPQAFAPDGTLLIREQHPETGTDLGVLAVDGGGASRPLLSTAFTETNPAISPDGSCLAYQSNESGRAEVFVRPFPDVGARKWQISSEGGRQPLWAPDGRELFYISPSDRLMAVPIEVDPFTYGQPEVVFEQTYTFGVGSGRNYDVSPDGQRFLMIKEDDQAGVDTPTQAILVQNWFEELERLVPTDN